MEIADLFVVNKADRADAESIVHSLKHQLQMSGQNHIEVLKTVAVEGKGVNELAEKLQSMPAKHAENADRKLVLMTEKALRIIASRRMRGFDVARLRIDLSEQMDHPGFNLYSFLQPYT